jgi:hypothetical protein
MAREQLIAPKIAASIPNEKSKQKIGRIRDCVNMPFRFGMHIPVIAVDSGVDAVSAEASASPWEWQ